MFDEHVLCIVSRDEDFSDSKKELRFDFRKCSNLVLLSYSVNIEGDNLVI